MNSFSIYIVPSLVVVVFLVLGATVRIVGQYERAVVFTLGRFRGVKGPGLVFLIPFFQEMVRVDFKYGARHRENRRNSFEYSRHHAVALCPSVDGDRRQTEFDDHLPHANRPHQADYADSR